ncbi:MAG: aspartate--tRNA(Asn) ligase [Gammaproteobacteria bacterium]|nr:aspartate--tRNA(Asn) ligase [Gammaproteobacteria bacterium]
MSMTISSELNPTLKLVNIADHIGKEVELRGFVYKVRVLSEFGFILLQHGDYLIQVVFTGDLGATGIKENGALSIKGTVTETNIKDVFVNPKHCEIQLTDYTILSTPSEPMPFDVTKKKLDVHNDVKFDFRYLSMRHPLEKAIFRIQSALVQGVRAFLMGEQFTEVRSPKIVKEGAEGGANIFSFEYFGKQAFLTQSPQFYKEFCTGVFERVFEIAPVFRAEKHHTNRHINEYTSIDLEFSHIESFYDVLNLEAAMLKYVFAHLNEQVSHELAMWKVELPVINTIPVLRFYEVKQIVEAEYGIKPKDSFDLAPIEELKISEYIKAKYDSDFVFITHYPSAKRPFYAKDDPDEPELTLSFDLLFRGIEITSGGQRIHDYDELIAKMRAKDMNPEEFEFFSNAHKYGLPPHGGLGMGLERLTQKLLGLDNIKSATMFPRDATRLSP